jgi:hypothetical protein
MRRTLTAVAAAAALTGVSVLAPACAQAAFSSSARATMPVATFSLAATDGTFRVDCTRNPTGPYHLLTLAAETPGAIAGANGYQVLLAGPAGEQFVESFGQEGDMVTYVKKKGDWTYSVRAVRTITPGNVWTGPFSAPRLVTCDRD